MPNKVIKAASDGYNYKFASLADLIIQGEELPKMRLARVDGSAYDYVQYFDGKDWQLGVPVIPLNNKSNNEMQNYGASLSYARRYTALMALQLATSEDELVEFDIPHIEEVLSQALTVEQLNDIYNTIPDRYKPSVRPSFTNRKQELTQTREEIIKANQQ